MNKKTAIIAAVLLGGAACVYAVTEMGEDELITTDPRPESPPYIDPPPTMPPIEADAGTEPGIYVPDEPEGALDPVVQRLLSEGLLARGPSCGNNRCEATELCCVNTGECVPAFSAQSCRGPEGETIEPPTTRE